MPLVSLALVPNSPLLLPKLSATVHKRLAKTREAIDRLLPELYARQVEIIIIAAYADNKLDGTCLLQSSYLPYSFAEWGDVITTGQVSIATGYTHALKEKSETNQPIPLRTVERLPINFAVPAHWLKQVFVKQPFVFLELSTLTNLDELHQLALLLREHINNAPQRVLLVAAGNLAAHLGKNKAEALIYDKYFQRALQPLNSQALANIDGELRKRVKETSWAPTLLLALLSEDLGVKTEILSYEAPAGVGYIVAEFNF